MFSRAADSSHLLAAAASRPVHHAPDRDGSDIDVSQY